MSYTRVFTEDELVHMSDVVVEGTIALSYQDQLPVSEEPRLARHFLFERNLGSVVLKASELGRAALEALPDIGFWMRSQGDSLRAGDRVRAHLKFERNPSGHVAFLPLGGTDRAIMLVDGDAGLVHPLSRLGVHAVQHLDPLPDRALIVHGIQFGIFGPNPASILHPFFVEAMRLWNSAWGYEKIKFNFDPCPPLGPGCIPCNFRVEWVAAFPPDAEANSNTLAVTRTDIGGNRPRLGGMFPIWFLSTAPWSQPFSNNSFPTPTANEYDLLTAVVHEVGHALGLKHIHDRNSFMYESGPLGTWKRELSPLDVEAIKSVYGN